MNNDNEIHNGQSEEAARRSAEELDERIADLEAGRNCHVHELIDDDEKLADTPLRNHPEI